MANKLNNNSLNDGELLAWFLSSQIREIVLNIDDSNIQEFINIIHRQASASGLFLESVSARIETMKSVKFYNNILACLHHLHVSHSGRLIVLLFNKFLGHQALHLANKAANLVSSRLEMLLDEKESFVHAQLSSTDVSHLKECLATKKLMSRNSRLVGLLNRLAMSFYDLSPTDVVDSSSRKFIPSSVFGVSIDKSWYLQQVKRSCCGSSSAPAKQCAKLLSNLSLSDIMLVMTSKEFRLSVLEECLVQGISLPQQGRAASIDSLDRLPGLLSDPERSPTPGAGVKEGPPLYRAASQVLLQHIKNVVELLPLPAQVYRPEQWWDCSQAESKYSARLDDFFSSWEGQQRLTHLLPSLTTLLTTYPRLPGRRPSLPPHCVLDMVRTGVLCLEMIKWSVASCRSECLRSGEVSMIRCCLEVAGLTLSNPHLSSALSMSSNNTLAASAAISLTDFILASCPQIRLPHYPWSTLTEALQSPAPPGLLVAHSNVARLLLLVERSELPPQLERAAPVITGLARLSQFTFLSRAPPLAFSLGWEPQLKLETNGHYQLSGNLGQDLLQEHDLLHQFLWRINSLGWTSKAQFEETWMCLLSVLNVPQDDLTSDEAAALGQSTALVVSALSSLLVNTMALPVAGVPGARLLHHPRDSPHPSLIGGSRGQQLTTIQNIIHMRAEAGAVGLPVDSSVNLERSSRWSGDCDPVSGYSPVPVSGYGPGQVSVSYMKTCVSYHEEGSEDRVSMASSILPLFLILREENLAAAGLDTISCVHFITDLFSQWLSRPSTLPLTVLTSAVRSLVMVSDIFTQDAQFCWMLDTLSELYRNHPAEDELLCELLLLGLSKAVSVVGFIEQDLAERLRKGLEAGLRSGQQSTRSASVHSLLYLLQREECSEMYSVAVEHLRTNLISGVRCESDQHSLALWSLMFYTLENCDDRDLVTPDLTADLLNTAVLTAGHEAVSRPVVTTILSGLERVLVSGVLRSPSAQLDSVVKLATDLMTDWPPSSVVPAVQLFLAAMYSSHSSHASADTSRDQPRTITDPEMLMSMMEQMSILFDCIRRSGPGQAELLTDILPGVLLDFFPASDIVNRVISEFISPGQPHPHLLAGVLRQIFRAQANSLDQQNMLTEWVLVSLPNFTRKAPLSYSIWCLSCFFLAASTNPWLQVCSEVKYYS